MIYKLPIILLLSISVTARAQRVDFSKITTSVVVIDSSHRLAAMLRKDTLLVYDSLLTIQQLLKGWLYTDSLQRDYYEKFLAANKILSYVNTRGYVLNKDRKKFNSAGRAYLKVMGRKPLKYPMLKLDILMRDLNDKPIGWVPQ